MSLCFELLKKSCFGKQTVQKTSNTPRVYPILFYGLDLKRNEFFYMSESAKAITCNSHHVITTNGIPWYISQIHPEDLDMLNDMADRMDCTESILPLINYRFRHKDGFYCDVRTPLYAA